MTDRFCWRYLFIGAFLGAIFFFWPIFLLLFSLLAILWVFLSRINPSERRILIRIVLAALIFRLLFTLLIAIFYIPALVGLYEGTILNRLIGHFGVLFRDFYREIQNGVHLGRYFAGHYGDATLKEVAHEGIISFLNIGAYLKGFLNWIFGASFLNLLIYPIISLPMVILTYYLAKEIFSRDVAILSSCILGILPSFVIWSCINIRTSLGIIAMLITALSFVKFSKNNNFILLLPLAVSLFLFRLAKAKFFAPLLIILPIVLFLCIRIDFRKKIAILALLLIVGLPVIKKRNFFTSELQVLIVDTTSRQKAYALNLAGSNYRIYDDFIYTSDIAQLGRLSPFVLVKALPKGIAYFLFAPFPWRIYNQLRLYSYPQIMIWYFFFPFSLLGMLIGLRYRVNRTLPLIVFSFFWVAILSLVMGNEGIAARQRDLILPFFYIFASASVMQLLGKKIFEKQNSIR